MPPKKRFSLTRLDKKYIYIKSHSIIGKVNNFRKNNTVVSDCSIEEKDVKKRKKNKPFNDLGTSTKLQFMEKAAPIIVNAISEVFIANGRSTPSNNDIVSFSAEFQCGILKNNSCLL